MKPLTLLIKPASGMCNMDCTYCFYKPSGRQTQKPIMDKNTVDTLIQRVKEYQPSALSVVFQGGEPTLAGLDFFEYFVSTAKQNIICPTDFSLQTNGLLIDEAFASFLKESRFLVGVSLDGNQPTNDRYRRDKNEKSVFTRTINAVSILKKYGIDFNILSVVDSKNADEVEETYGFFKGQGFDFLQFIPCIDEGSGIGLNAEKYGSFLKKIFDLWYDDYMNGKYISIRHIDNYIGAVMGFEPENCAMCGVCGNYFVIESDGEIYPCDFYCKSEFELGSVFDKKPFEKSEKQTEFIKQSYLIHEKCNKCRYYPLCRGGCRRDRVNNLTENRYCSAYIGFFDYAVERMAKIARSISRDGTE